MSAPSSQELADFIEAMSHGGSRGRGLSINLFDAVEQLENVAFTRGVYMALSRIEYVCNLTPDDVTAEQLLVLLREQRDGIIGEWRKKLVCDCPAWANVADRPARLQVQALEQPQPLDGV